MKFEKLNNTRDLAGIRTKDGRMIVPGKLIRSGQLGRGSEKDLEKIADMVSVIVDFRTGREIAETPDPSFDGIDSYHIPIFEELSAGVSRDEESDEEAFSRIQTDPEAAFDYMCGMYEGFVTSDKARKGYERFVRLLTQEREKAVLWHCTVGKDRAGFAAAIVLEILGADRDVIKEDYLKTNVNIEPDIRDLEKQFFEMNGISDPAAGTALRTMFQANKGFLDAAYDKAAELYGDFKGFIKEGLDISDEDVEAIRDLYLR